MPSPKKPKLPPLQAALRELNSAYKHSGASKELTDVEFKTVVRKRKPHQLTGKLTVHARQESPWGDMESTKCSFDLTAAEMAAVAKEAPCFQGRLARLSKEFFQAAKVFSDSFEEEAVRIKEEAARICHDGLQADIQPPKKPKFIFKPRAQPR